MSSFETSGVGEFKLPPGYHDDPRVKLAVAEEAYLAERSHTPPDPDRLRFLVDFMCKQEKQIVMEGADPAVLTATEEDERYWQAIAYRMGISPEQGEGVY